jgi:hypothetical protein
LGSQGVYIIRWDFNEDFVFRRVQYGCTQGGADAAKWLKQLKSI